MTHRHIKPEKPHLTAERLEEDEPDDVPMGFGVAIVIAVVFAMGFALGLAIHGVWYLIKLVAFR